MTKFHQGEKLTETKLDILIIGQSLLQVSVRAICQGAQKTLDIVLAKITGFTVEVGMRTKFKTSQQHSC